MTCFIAQNELSAFADDALEAARAAELQHHLTGCANCTRELQEIRRVRTLLRAMPVHRAPPDFLAKVKAKAQHKSLFERVGEAIEPLLRLPRPAQAGLALAASLVLAVTVFFNQGQRMSAWDLGAAPAANEVVQPTSTPALALSSESERLNDALAAGAAGNRLDEAKLQKNLALEADAEEQTESGKRELRQVAAVPPAPEARPSLDNGRTFGEGDVDASVRNRDANAQLPSATPRAMATPARTTVAATPTAAPFANVVVPDASRGTGGATTGSTGLGATSAGGSSGYVAPTKGGLYASTPQSVAAAPTPAPVPAPVSRGKSMGLTRDGVGSSRVDLQACKLEYSIVSPK